jgi:iron(III) transport system substrate-binding protein
MKMQNTLQRMAGGLLALAAVAISAGAHAQSQNWDDVVAAAKKEGSLVIYNGSVGLTVQKLADKFQQKYGIKAEVLQARASEIQERLRIERATGRVAASVTYQGSNSLERFAEDGTIVPHGDLPHVKDVLPPLVENGTVLQTCMGNFALLYNTNLVKGADVPKSWKDLLKPQWQGKILSDDFRAAGAGSGTFQVTYKAFGADFHEKLRQQKPVFSRDASEAARRVARGEFAFYLPFNVSEFGRFKGLPINAIIPEEGAPYLAFGAGLVAGAPSPNAGRLFMDFVLTEEAQLLMVSDGWRPAIGGLESKMPPESVRLMTGKLLGTSVAADQDKYRGLAIELYK